MLPCLPFNPGGPFTPLGPIGPGCPGEPLNGNEDPSSIRIPLFPLIPFGP
jgi:hypothetical protein